MDQFISILRVVGGIFHFYSNFNRTFCKQTMDILHCLPISHKKDARLYYTAGTKYIGGI